MKTILSHIVLILSLPLFLLLLLYWLWDDWMAGREIGGRL